MMNKGRSQTTFVYEDGQQIGKRVYDMEFEEYLRDSLRNLQWRKTKDLPSMLKAEQDGFIGIKQSEYDLSMQVIELAIESIHSYFGMPSHERFIYV